MNKSQLIEELIDELCLLSNDGLPNLKSRESLCFISEFFNSKGMDDLGKQIIQNLVEADKQFKNPALNKIIKYKNTKGEDSQGMVGNLLRRPKEEDAYKQAVKTLGGEDSDTYKKAMTDLGGENQPDRDIEKEKKKKGGAEEKPEPQVAPAFSGKAGDDYRANLPKNDPAYVPSEKEAEPKEDKKGKLKEKFSKKSEITENMVSDSGRTLPNGTRVRDIVDEDGNPIEVNNSEGRKKAAEVIRTRLNGLESKIKEAVKNFGETVEVKKWLGEVGEMSALAQILEEDVEAYLLTDSERKNDIVFVKSNGDEGTLYTGYLSVKTTLQGEQVNKLGANCKADLDKLSEGAKPIFETTINGKTFNLKPTNVLGSVIDIKSGFFAKFSLRDGVEKTSEGKLTKVNPDVHPNVKEEDIIEIKGERYFKDQSSYLKNTSVSDSDINEFFDKEVDKYLNNLSKPKKGETNQIQDADEIKQTKEYLKEVFLSDYNRKKQNGEPYTLYDMHDTMHYVIGKTSSDAEMPIEATTDTMAIEFSEKSINPTVSVIKKEDANQDIKAQLDKNKEIQDERERITDLATGCLNIRSRTRAIGKPLRYDGIDNISPIAKKPTEKRTPISEYVKS